MLNFIMKLRLSDRDKPVYTPNIKYTLYLKEDEKVFNALKAAGIISLIDHK